MFSFISHLSIQCVNLFISSCKERLSWLVDVCLNNLASSAYRYMLESTLRLLDKSFIYIINKSGPNIDPWGTPLRTEAQLE